GGHGDVVGIDGGVFACLHAVLGNAEFVVEAVEIGFGEDDADGAGFGFGVGDERVAGQGHVVAAGSGYVGHGNDNGLLFTQKTHLAPEVVGGGDFAAGRIDADDYAFDVGIAADVTELFGEAVGGDGAGFGSVVGGAAHDDVAFGGEDGDVAT